MAHIDPFWTVLLPLVFFAFIWLGVFDRVIWPLVVGVIKLMGVGFQYA